MEYCDVNEPCASRHVVAGLLTVLLLVSSNASADEPARWQFRASPYLWGAGLKGSVATLPPAQPVDVDVSFGDVLDKLDVGLMGAVEGRRNRWGFLTEILYLSLSADADTPGPLFSNLDYQMDMWLVTAAVTYALSDSDRHFLDIVAGVTYWDVDNRLAFEQGVASRRKISEQESWADPIAGLRGRIRLDANWSLAGHVFSAVAGDSDSAWELYAGVGYELGERWSLVAGYRHKEVDYAKAGFVYDVEMSGPLLGAAYRF